MSEILYAAGTFCGMVVILSVALIGGIIVVEGFRVAWKAIRSKACSR
jgi:hypothetical protein